MKLNHHFHFVKHEALAGLIFQQAQTLLCFSPEAPGRRQESSMWQSDSWLYYTPQRNPEMPAKHAAAGRQGVLTALVGFLDLTLDLSFSGSPESSFFSGSFTTLRISLSGQQEKKKKKKRVLQNVSTLSILCYYLFYLLLVTLHHTKAFVELLSPYTCFSQCKARLGHL